MNDKLYGQPKELDATELQLELSKSGRTRSGKWAELAFDLHRRLEQTPMGHALSVSFEEPKIAKCAQISLYAYFKQRMGLRAVTIIFRDNPPTLYVSRGKNWGQCPKKPEPVAAGNNHRSK